MDSKYISGDFIIVTPIAEGDKVRAEICNILYKDKIKYIKSEGAWYVYSSYLRFIFVIATSSFFIPVVMHYALGNTFYFHLIIFFHSRANSCILITLIASVTVMYG